MVDMINRHQRVDAGSLGGFQFRKLKTAFVVRKRVQRVAHEPDRRLMQINDLDAGHHAQQFGAGLDHALDPGMLVQGYPHRHADFSASAEGLRTWSSGTT